MSHVRFQFWERNNLSELQQRWRKIAEMLRTANDGSGFTFSANGDDDFGERDATLPCAQSQ
jgi:hypothetical protein